MTDPLQQQLLGHLLGALDDDEAKSVADRLKSDPQFRQELDRLQRQVAPLEAAREQFPVPPGLAERACAFVAAAIDQADPVPEPEPRADDRPVPRSKSARMPMTPETNSPSWISRIRWADVVMALSVFCVAAFLTIPAIQAARFNARKAACQDNLRQLGMAMNQYSDNNQGYFPFVPPEGKLAAAGIYAPVLARDGYLTEPERLVCPDSPLADKDGFRIPPVEEIQAAGREELADLRRRMGGSYGYSLGHMEGERYSGTKNLGRSSFALMADAPGLARSRLQTDNHGGKGQNVLFEDGSLRFVATPKPNDLFDDFFRNDNGEIAAGLHRADSVIGSSATPPITYVNFP